MRRCCYILLMLISCLSTIQAEEVVRNGLHCGQLVRITATPDAGYRFVGWSDGESANPRLIEVTEAKHIVAFFERWCSANYIIPVVRLYEQILLVDKHSLDSLGYSVQESDVHWYRIVGEADDIQGDEPNDKLEATGFYINTTSLPPGYYYVQIDTGMEGDCPEILRSPTLSVGAMGTQQTKDTPPSAVKFIRDNMLFIRRGDHTYDMWGYTAP